MAQLSLIWSRCNQRVLSLLCRVPTLLQVPLKQGLYKKGMKSYPQ